MSARVTAPLSFSGTSADGSAFPAKLFQSSDDSGARAVAGELKTPAGNDRWMRDCGLRLWLSGLRRCLKPPAAILLLLSDESGRGLTPLIDELSWTLGQSTRATQRQFKRLQAMGIVKFAGGSGIGGRGMRREFQLYLDRLPKRSVWAGLKKPRVARFTVGGL